MKKKTTPAPATPATPTAIAEKIAVEPDAPIASAESEGDAWVVPSQVSRDRVRSAPGSTRMTEMEKAQAAFKRADTAPMHEGDSGIVEPRMLRASEVKEFLEGPTPVHVESEPSYSESDGADIPTASKPIAPPSAADLEKQILGSRSALVEQDDSSWEQEIETVTSQPETGATGFAPAVSDEFKSSKYSGSDASEADIPEIIPMAPPAEQVPPIEHVTSCTKCGEVINIDNFSYPREVYSAMAAARLKQVRFFIVQGKYSDAQNIIRIARSLYLQAGDTAGVAEIDTIVHTLASRS
ncbi:MAG: hypothetical protein ACTSV2_08420 [Candidatus Thorarchaeota archaeon]